MLNLKRIIGPTAEPITLEMAKQQCRVDFDDEDALIALYIAAATEYAEKRLNRSLIAQTWVLSLDTFPWSGYRQRPGTQNDVPYGSDYWFEGMAILLPQPPAIEVTSITYLDYNGDRQTLDPSTYTLDTISEPARIIPKVGSYWPFLEAYQPGAIQITYVAGYGPDATTVPNRVMLALLLLTAHFYNNREATSQGVNITTVPMAVDALLNSSTFTTFSYGA